MNKVEARSNLTYSTGTAKKAQDLQYGAVLNTLTPLWT